MKTHLDCFPCFLKQAVIAVRLCTEDENIQADVMKGVAEEIQITDISKPPAFTTTFIHRKIRHLLGKDPFDEIKTKYNRIALSLYPELQEIVWRSKDPLMTAARLAIAGNVIDFGIYTSFDIKGTIDRALNKPLTINDFTYLKKLLDENSDILYLLDNAGEVVFDKLFIEVLCQMGINVKAVAKGEPVLNDSTLKDAIEVGLTDVCEVIGNDSDCIGTILEMTSERFRHEFNRSRFIISKGQGNFETLSYQSQNLNGRKVCYMFQSKCDVVSRELGLPIGSMLLKVD